MNRRSFIKGMLGGLAGLAGLEVMTKPKPLEAGHVILAQQHVAAGKSPQVRMIINFGDGVAMELLGELDELVVTTSLPTNQWPPSREFALMESTYEAIIKGPSTRAAYRRYDSIE